MITDKTPQHYRLTLEDAIQHYKDGLLTVKGLVYSYLKIRLAPTWQVTLHHKAVCELLGISKAAFYKAISALAKESLITWEAPEGIVVRLAAKSSTVSNSESTNVDSESTNVDSESTNVDSESTNVDNKPPKPAQNKASSNPSDSYQIFIKSLSSDQREKFKAFCKRQADRLPKPVVMLDRWIACHYLELWQQYKQAHPDQPIASSKDKFSAATVTKLKEKLDQQLSQLINAGKLHVKQHLIDRGYVILANGDADLIQNWIAT